MEIGIDRNDYWDMTPWELERVIAAKQKQRKEEMQLRAVIAYQQAGLTAVLVSKSLGSKQKVPDIKKAFPGFFDDSEQTIVPAEPGKKPFRQQDWRIMKARMEMYAAARRKWGEKKRGNNDRGTTSADHGQDQRPTEGDGGGDESV